MVVCVCVLLTGRPSDNRPTCPPPITAERARQNIPSASSYMSLKHSQSQQDPVAMPESNTQRGSLSTRQACDDETPTRARHKKKVRRSLGNCPSIRKIPLCYVVDV